MSKMEYRGKNIPAYILYDGRYNYDPERASVCCCCDTLKEARKMAREYGSDTVIVDTKTGEQVF